jgi:hypothetical protein
MGNIDQVRKKSEQGAKEKKNAFIVAIGGLSGVGRTDSCYGEAAPSTHSTWYP